MKKIHIIVPVYNPPEKFFRECLRSIREQEHKNFACILVDDGSQPETAAICDEVATQDPRFTVIHKQNEGANYARRDGVFSALADGAEYISFIDSDDTVESGYLSMMLGTLLETGADACFCGFNFVCDGKTTAPHWSPSPSESGTSEDRRGMVLSVLDIPHNRFGTRVNICGGLYRTSLFDGVDWDFSNVKIGEDTRISCQLMLNTRKAAYLQDRLYNYIQHHASAMHTEDALKTWDSIIESKYAVAGFIKQCVPEFDFAEHCAIREAQYYYGLLEKLLATGADGRLLRDETDECVRHIRHAMKTLGAILAFSRRQRVGLFVLNVAGLSAYRLLRKMTKRRTAAVGMIVTLVSYDNYGCIIQRYALQKFLDGKSFYFNSFFIGSCATKTPLRKTIANPMYSAKAFFRVCKRLLSGRRPLFDMGKIIPFGRMKWTRRFVKMRIRQKRFDVRNAGGYGTYIVGSDQVWREWGADLPRALCFFLDFVINPQAKRIAYAASFGKDTLESAGLSGREEEIRPLLGKFDAISVREESGVKIIKETWGLDATHVLDPTLLLTREDYSTLIDNPVCPIHDVKSVFYYFIDMSVDKMSLVEKIARKLGVEFDGIYPGKYCTLLPVEQWLKGFRDSDFIVTDSFHGTAFAIVNRKSFVVFANEMRGIARITSLLGALGLEERMVVEEKIECFNLSKLNAIDYDAVHAKLDKLREFSGNWLLTQLRKPKSSVYSIST